MVIELPPTDGSEGDDYIHRLEQALSELPERQREIFRLSTMEDMTYLEIAERLGIEVSVVSRQLNKALGYLDGRTSS